MTRPRSDATSTEREVSAGGVVLRGDDVLVIVPTRRAADGHAVLALPKGHVDPGETAVQAAVRVVREEGGVDAEVVAELGDVRYVYMRSGRRVRKVVTYFALRYAGGDVADHDEEVEEARWLPVDEAARTLSYQGDREMVARARLL